VFIDCVIGSKKHHFRPFSRISFFLFGRLDKYCFCFNTIVLRIKASLHMVAISALTIFIIGLSIHNQTRNINGIAFLVLMNGFVASSRLEMKAHTPKELVIGLLLGIIPQLILLHLWL
jgi:hypothetical protein